MWGIGTRARTRSAGTAWTSARGFLLDSQESTRFTQFGALPIDHEKLVGTRGRGDRDRRGTPQSFGHRRALHEARRARGGEPHLVRGAPAASDVDGRGTHRDRSTRGKHAILRRKQAARKQVAICILNSRAQTNLVL